MKYRKYIVLKWDQYYPSGGLRNISDSFDELADAERCASSEDGSWKSDYSEIIDRDTWESPYIHERDPYRD